MLSCNAHVDILLGFTALSGALRPFRSYRLKALTEGIVKIGCEATRQFAARLCVAWVMEARPLAVLRHVLGNACQFIRGRVLRQDCRKAKAIE